MEKHGETLYLPAELEEQAKTEQATVMKSDEREGLVRLYLETLIPGNWAKIDIFSRKEYLRGNDTITVKGDGKTPLRLEYGNLVRVFWKHKSL